MELIYKGKNAIVTGASGGMGLEISKMLSENNINVLMLDIQSPSKMFLDENEKDMFIYNLDKKYFCLNIFSLLKRI